MIPWTYHLLCATSARTFPAFMPREPRSGPRSEAEDVSFASPRETRGFVLSRKPLKSLEHEINGFRPIVCFQCLDQHFVSQRNTQLGGSSPPLRLLERPSTRRLRRRLKTRGLGVTSRFRGAAFSVSNILAPAPLVSV
jgi:hypothetical protein